MKHNQQSHQRCQICQTHCTYSFFSFKIHQKVFIWKGFLITMKVIKLQDLIHEWTTIKSLMVLMSKLIWKNVTITVQIMVLNLTPTYLCIEGITDSNFSILLSINWDQRISYRVSQIKEDETKQLFQTKNMQKILFKWHFYYF